MAGTSPAMTKTMRLSNRSLAQIRRRHADLHDARFIDPGDPDIFEDLVVDLALARVLNHQSLGAGKQRPECRSLRLLFGIGAEGKIHWVR